MITDGHKCRLCSGKMSKPKLVTEGPHKGQNRIFCVHCGHLIFVAPVATEQYAPAQQQKAHVPNEGFQGGSGNANGHEPMLVLRGGHWEIDE